MSEIDNGGPAFPMPSAIFKTAFDAIKESVPLEKQEQAGEALAASAIGMTLRDYFAAHAPEVPEGFEWAYETKIVNLGIGIDGIGRGPREVKESSASRIIRWRWHYADAMLEARK